MAENHKKLCLALMHSDTEDEAYEVLKASGYWDDDAVWRFFGDNENNFATIGNQQSRPEAALVEKLVNSIDARLINECLVRGIEDEGPGAPASIRDAVALFFEEGASGPDAGRVKNWVDTMRTREGRLITLSASGNTPPGDPTLSVADAGEGQTPSRIPDTFMSLQKSNKLRIPFVQGKHNMGSTGALQFCGDRKLQLVVTRRNPVLLGQDANSTDHDWGFTIVRREDPSSGRRSSMFTYLAPLGAEATPRRGEVLHFPSATMPIFPEGRDPHAREAEWGSLVVLYEYELPGVRSNIIQSDPSLLRRLDFLLAEVALPIRLYECRKSYRGHAGSFENNLNGISVRLEDDRSENLEPDFPSPGKLGVRGEELKAMIYAFKKKKADRYRKQEGIAFIVNGQTHGHITLDFFRRTKVGLAYLADSLLVTIDCSNMNPRLREDLFMNSRDRLRDGELKQEIEEQLREMLRSHPGLMDLQARRREEDIKDRLQDSKPLEDVLQSLLKKSPTLSSLFLQGMRMPNPFKLQGTGGEPKKFKGKRFPTFFRFRNLKDDENLVRNSHLNQRVRLSFETDVGNDYFYRERDAGQLELLLADGANWSPVVDFSLSMHQGAATVTFGLPASAQAGDQLVGMVRVTDSVGSGPFVNNFMLNVKSEHQPSSGTDGKRRRPRRKKKGKDREEPQTLNLPNITPVTEDQWEEKGYDKYTALTVTHVGGDESDKPKGQIYDFFINVDNIYLRTEQKNLTANADLLQAKFTYAMVLIGLGLIHDHAERLKHHPEDEEDISEAIARMTRAVAPMVLPMIETLGGMGLESAA